MRITQGLIILTAWTLLAAAVDAETTLHVRSREASLSSSSRKSFRGGADTTSSDSSSSSTVNLNNRMVFRVDEILDAESSTETMMMKEEEQPTKAKQPEENMVIDLPFDNTKEDMEFWDRVLRVKRVEHSFSMKA